MKKAFILQVILGVLRLSDSVDLEYDDVSYATVHQSAFLRCGMMPVQPIKELWWFKIGASEERVYYYDPTSVDAALMKRARRSSRDNTSLEICPTQLSDEGEYKCRIVVWDNTGDSTEPSVPISKEARMMLKVNVPPEKVEITHLTSGRNLSLRCKAEGAKPPAHILWTKTSPDGVETEIPDLSKTREIEPAGELYDTAEQIFYQLEENEMIAKISCVVRHHNTNTTIYKNITFVSPAIQNALKVTIQRFAEPVLYSSIENQDGQDNKAGLVKISADPGFKVPYNTSVTLKAAAPGVFPEPRYLWWVGDQTGIAGRELRIDNLEEDKSYYVLAENPLGRVVLEVPVHITTSDYSQWNDSSRDDDVNEGDTTEGLDTGAIIGIVIGALIAVFFIGFAVWYWTIRDGTQVFSPKKEKPHTIDEETVPFRSTEKPLLRTISTQTLEGRRSRREPSIRGAASADNIMNHPPNAASGTPPPGYASKERPQARRSSDYHEKDSSSEDNLRSAHDEDSSSERSLATSDGQVINGRTDIV